MTEPTLDDLVRALAEARATKQRAEGVLAIIEADAEALVKERFGSQLEIAKSCVGRADAALKEADEALRVAAVEAFEATQEKKPHPAVQVKMYTTLQYDETEAVDYCREHMPQALKLDKPKFERIARATEPGFVTFLVTPRATVAQKLAEYVGE